MTQQTLLCWCVCGWEICVCVCVCVCVTFSCHWLDLSLLCTFSIKQQPVIRARQRKMGKETQYILPTCWGNWHSSSAVVVSPTANSYDIPRVWEKLTRRKLCTESLCCSWVGGGWRRDTRVMRWQSKRWTNHSSLWWTPVTYLQHLTVVVTSEGVVVKRV